MAIRNVICCQEKVRTFCLVIAAVTTNHVYDICDMNVSHRSRKNQYIQTNVTLNV